MGHINFMYLPAGVSLAAACIDTLGQGVVQSGIDDIQIDWLLVHLTAWVPGLSYITGDNTERCKHCTNTWSVSKYYPGKSIKAMWLHGAKERALVRKSSASVCA